MSDGHEGKRWYTKRDAKVLVAQHLRGDCRDCDNGKTWHSYRCTIGAVGREKHWHMGHTAYSAAEAAR